MNTTVSCKKTRSGGKETEALPEQSTEPRAESRNRSRNLTPWELIAQADAGEERRPQARDRRMIWHNGQRRIVALIECVFSGGEDFHPMTERTAEVQVDSKELLQQ